MSNLQLRPLSLGDADLLYPFLQSMPKEENGFQNGAAGLTRKEFEDWLVRQEANAAKTEIEDGYRVPQGIWFLYVDGQPAGMAKLRYFLTDRLRTAGGHLGYAIAPAFRGHGYAAAMVNEIKRIAAQKGIDEMLVTIHNDNPASIRTALKCGGRIENIDEDRHYIWIPCNQKD